MVNNLLLNYVPVKFDEAFEDPCAEMFPVQILLLLCMPHKCNLLRHNIGALRNRQHPVLYET